MFCTAQQNWDGWQCVLSNGISCHIDQYCFKLNNLRWKNHSSHELRAHIQVRSSSHKGTFGHKPKTVRKHFLTPFGPPESPGVDILWGAFFVLDQFSWECLMITLHQIRRIASTGEPPQPHPTTYTQRHTHTHTHTRRNTFCEALWSTVCQCFQQEKTRTREQAWQHLFRPDQVTCVFGD